MLDRKLYFYDDDEFSCKGDNPNCEGPLNRYVNKDNPQWKPYINCEKHGKQLIEGWVKA